MAIPDFQTLMIPTLQVLKNGDELPFKQVVNELAVKFRLTDDELADMLPSRRAPTFYNRVAWAKFYLKKANLVSQTKRSFLSITDAGKRVLESKLERINIRYLEEHTDFEIDKKTNIVEATLIEEVSTPEEIFEATHEKLNHALAAELIEITKSCSPSFFERLVVELLLAMGYGGSRAEAGRAIGQSGDGGIDGIIDEDKLGLDSIYIQAKRWEGTVGRPEIQKFVGALQGNRAHKGVFITTSDFTKDAQEYVKNISNKVVLINGFTLAKLMIENDVGVSIAATYEVKKIDSDYFVDE
ncbi:MAG: restriction endonuclease [Methylotenera sp.]|nr:restriction endonuclease [Methylotenera sp.]